MFEAKDIIKSFKKRKVLRGISLKLKRNEIVGLLGPNGAGKTTLFKIMIGLIRPDSGNVILDDRDITGTELHKLIRMGVGYLPQEPSLFTGLSVYENLKIVANSGSDSEDSNRRIEDIIKAMSLETVRDSAAENLSGGEKRRLEVARSLLLKPNYMLFDEPFSQIDPRTVYELMEIIKSMRERNIGVLITDHSAREVFRVCNRIYIIADGKIVAEGTPSELRENQLVKDVYLGRLFEL